MERRESALEPDEEDEECESEAEKIEESKNGEETEWSAYYARQLGNDDVEADWDKEAAEYWEALNNLEDFVYR